MKALVEVATDHTAGWNVPVVYPDPTASDTLTDQCRQALTDGRLADWLEDQQRLHDEEIMAKTLRTCLAIVIESTDPKLEAAALYYAGGGDLWTKTGPQIAKQLRVSKQRFFYHVNRIRERFHLQHSPHARNQESKDKMRSKNYKRNGHNKPAD
jgi:hypothetical protein